MHKLKSSLVVVILFIIRMGNSQSLDEGFIYADNTLSNKQIRIEISKILATVDSVETANNFHARIVYHMVLYATDTTNNSKRWKHFQKRFIRALAKKVGKENVVVHQIPITTKKRHIKKDHLSVGPVFVAT